MAWVRIDDQVPRHRKTLKAGPAASWLWVCGIAHSQSQLTDGFISFEALPMIGVAGMARCRRLAEILVHAGLFEHVEGGYLVHDYLDLNPTREVVLRKRAADAARKSTAEANRNPNGIRMESRAPRAGVPSHPIQVHEKKNASHGAAKPPPDARVKDFLTWFQTEYKSRRHGADYLVKWDRDGSLVKAMLGATDLERLKKLAQILLSDKTDEDFICQSDRGIPILSTKFNWLSERLAAWEARQATAATG